MIAQKNPPYTIVTRGYNRALVTMTRPSCYIEVSIDIDSATAKPRVFRGEVEYHYRLLRNPGDPLANWQSKDCAVMYTSPEAIAAAIAAIDRQVNVVLPRTLRRSHRHPAYKPMAKIAKSTIKYYLSDFTYHDCLRLAGLPAAAPFIWAVRDSGTWMMAAWADTEPIKYSINHDNPELYRWNGNDLVKTDATTALNIINNWR